MFLSIPIWNTYSYFMFHRAALSGGYLSGQIDGELESRLNYLKDMLDSISIKVSKRLKISLGKYKSNILNEWHITGDALLKDNIIDKIIKIPGIKLTEYTVKSITEGIDAQGEVLIRVESDGTTYTGRGADTDIIVASAKAYVNALNRVVAAKNGKVTH